MYKKNEEYKTAFRVFLILLLPLALILGCGETGFDKKDAPVESPKKPVYGGIYRRAFADTFIVLDPAEIKDSNSHEVARQIFDGLVEFDETGNVIPAIAASWEISEDKLNYVFTLRKDCRFHSISGGQKTKNGGRLISAEDVEYTFHRLLSPRDDFQGSFFWVIEGAQDFSKGKSDKISGIKVIASDSIQFKLEKPFAPFVSLLAMCNAFIVPHEDAESDSDFNLCPVGAGPFRWKERTESKLVVEANDEYYRGRPYLDYIEFVIIPDDSKRYQAFKKGLLMHVDVPDPEYKNVKQDPTMSKNLIERSLWGTNYLGFNVDSAPFNNKKVRQAINYSIDKEAIVKLVLNDRARIANGVLPQGMIGFNQDLAGYPFDLEKARKLLAEAGFPDGKGFPEIELQFNKDEIHTRISEFVLANLRDIGIKCRVKELDFGAHLSSVESGIAKFFRMGWTIDYPDPDSFLYTLFHSSNIGTGYNFSHFSDKQTDMLLDKARFETDPKARIKLYSEAERRIVEEAPWVFLYFYTTHLLHQPNVMGIKLGPLGMPFIEYRKIWLSEKESLD